MTIVSAWRRAAEDPDLADREKATTGGAALTEMRDDTVTATGRLPGFAVITATPAGWLRKASRKAFVMGC
jgi:hypothetical protein